jgi:hypothetical protein
MLTSRAGNAHGILLARHRAGAAVRHMVGQGRTRARSSGCVCDPRGLLGKAPGLAGVAEPYDG